MANVLFGRQQSVCFIKLKLSYNIKASLQLINRRVHFIIACLGKAERAKGIVRFHLLYMEKFLNCYDDAIGGEAVFFR